MKRRTASSGFTIVESLIVLAVTGVMFVSLVALVSGQQSRARFKSAVTDITTQIQALMNEASTGYYPSTDDISCTQSGGYVRITSGAAERGTNADCTYLGRAIMFGIPGTSPQEYRVQTLAGLRIASTGKEPVSLLQTKVRAIAPGNTVNVDWPDKSIAKRLQYGLEIAWMREADGSAMSGIAFATTPYRQVSYTGDMLDSGAVSLQVFPVPLTGAFPGPGVSARDGVDLIANSLGEPTLQTSSGDGPYRLCFRSGTTNQSALITIGAQNSNTSIESEVFNTPDCT